ncbi:MAG: hypothetical protein CTY20_14320 [Hyphomicrobium sp.]|nr:MAG: hypothetical protein CTY20_14320 [Hyphomicrobium sp.]
MSRSNLAAVVIAAALTLAPIVAKPAAGMSDLIVRESKRNVTETIDALAAALEAKGIKVIARVDHAAGAKAVGMELRPSEVLLFANPKLGTPLMQSNPEIGIDLPMKALAWQASDGRVYLGYTAPDKLKARYGIKDRDAEFNAMADALLRFSEVAGASAK